MTAAEREQVLVDWNDTAAEYPKDASLAKLVEEQVERAPNAVAVIFEESSSITYRELNERANQLAHELRKHGAGPDQLIGMCLNRSIDMIVALLAIIKAGAAYVPIDPDLPSERLRYMIEDSGARLLVTERNLVQDVAAFAGRTILLEDGDRRTNRIENRNIPARPGDPGCLIYTSGSTGRPKGVQVGRKALVNTLVDAKMAQAE